MKNSSFYENNLNEGDKPKLERFINELFLSIEHSEINEEFDEELIKKCYYNSYLLIFNALELLNSKDKDEINPYLLKAAETLETLSRLNHSKLNKEELIFDSMITYYISNNYPRAYVLSKDNNNLELPKYKEAIFIFMNKDFHRLRNLILNEINSKDYDEDLLIEKLESNKISNSDALEKMLSYSIFKALNNVLNFLLLGDEKFIGDSLELLAKYKNISLVHNFVDYWWVISCLEIIIKELYENSLWNKLKPFYSDSDEELNTKLTNYIFNYANRETPIVELWPSQISAIPKILENNENVTIKMPTSAGKTFIAELLILKYYMEGNFYNDGKVIYISPFKSLSNEIESSLKSNLNCLDLKISDFYGGFDSNEYEKHFLDELDILILTPEKFDVLLRTKSYLKEDIGLIIIDEGHIIGTYDDKLDKYSIRSTKLEFFMYRLKNIFKDSRIAFISGVLSNVEDFNKWISGNNNLIETKWKPTNIYVGALIWYKKDKSYIDYHYKNNVKFKKPIRFEFMNYFNKNCFTNNFRKKEIPKDDNEALALSAIEFSKEAPTYVYAPKKSETIKLANTILKLMNNLDIKCYDYNLRYYEENDNDIVLLIDSIKQEIGEDSELLDYIEHGFIIHHASLPDKVKGNIENVLRKRKLNLVIGTSTIVQGVNFPFKTVIFKGLYASSNLIDYSTFFNICGRAGRATEENNGRVLIFLGNVNLKNSEEKKKMQDKFRKFDNFYSRDNYQLKSIFYPILEKIKLKHFSQKCSLEEFIYKLINDFDLNEIFNNEEIMNIDSMDAQLLAFVEEEDDANELLKKFINVTLYRVQNHERIKQEYLKGFIDSRLAYLKKEFGDNAVRSRAYTMGLSLEDCKFIENNYEKLKNLFLQSKDWNSFSKHEKFNLLLKIALNMLDLNTLYYDNKINNKNEILKAWITNTPILEINNNKDSLTELNINKYINFCKDMLPWAITSILNFFKLKEPELQIPTVCEYFSEMFKYGIFDLKIVILMPWANNNYEFCKKLSKYIEKEELNFDKLYLELESLYNKLKYEWNEEELKEFKKYLDKFKQKDEKHEITFTLDNTIEITSEEYIYLLNNRNNISLYDLEGNYLSNIDYNNVTLSNDNINIENIWEIKSITNKELILKSVN